ncbi:amino acid adenylation domain-containing protein [Paenibacillus marchantiae]|uniref:amino acid adenylation domain-containing protein n=1 Tax=Paenibacillus marchantiae TaxID=3026433 RepID=UPI00237B07E3|nr:amino acid adenylation domain-containing protein [Paenibacillus marchantiae]WDQ32176.1 amino acid adenylation domain-containing protein [Paenibacillus marchantiae]
MNNKNTVLYERSGGNTSEEITPNFKIPFYKQDTSEIDVKKIRIKIQDDHIRHLHKICTDLDVEISTAFLSIFSVLLRFYSYDDEIAMFYSLSKRQSITEGLISESLSLDDSFITVIKNKMGVLSEDDGNQYKHNMKDTFYTPVFSYNRTWGFDELSQINKNSIVFAIKYENNSFCSELIYNSFSIGEDYIIRMHYHVINLINELLINPEQRIGNVSILSPLESGLVKFRGKDYVIPEISLNEILEKQAEKIPDKVAVIHKGNEITYRQLNARANQFARFLQLNSIVETDIVGICMDRSIEYIIVMFGIMKVGATYLPLDPHYPQSRNEAIIGDANPAIIITENDWVDRFELNKIIVWEHKQADISRQKDNNIQILLNYKRRMYIIYTSGSTGQPKGVQVQHTSVMNLLCSMTNKPGINENDNYLALASFSFDMSVPEVFLPLYVGAKLFIGNSGLGGDSEKLIDFISGNRITIMQATPTTWDLIFESEIDIQHNLKILCGAEPLPLNLLKKMLSKGYQVWNLYGPTETTVWSSLDRLEFISGNSVSIGKPIYNTSFQIVNKDLHLAPYGVPGELLIGGAGVTEGYLNKSSLSEEKFIELSVSGSKEIILYRTGDLVRINEENEIEYLGRLDNQVKIRGFRIETNDIEHHLETHPLVNKSLVLVLNDINNHKSLIAYIIKKKSDIEVTGNELLEFLRSKLPIYMIPRFVHFMDDFPLSSNGKIDRRLFPKPNENESLNVGFTTGDIYKDQIIKTLQEFLSVRQINLNDSFITHGGDSILAARIVSKLRKNYALDLEVVDLLKSKTICEFLRELSSMKKTTIEILIENSDKKQDIPASYAQQRLLFLNQLENGKMASYNIPVLWEIEGSLDIHILRRAFNIVIQRHDTLRTIFKTVLGQFYQIIKTDILFELEVIDISFKDLNEQKSQYLNFAKNEAAREFNMESGPLFNVFLFKLNRNQNILMVNMHHLISDGWSLDILKCELLIAYDSLLEKKPLQLNELKIQYADYARWQQKVYQEDKINDALEYWKLKLAGNLPVLEIPTDYTRGDFQTFRGSIVEFEIEENLLTQIRAFTRSNDITIFMFFLSTYKLLLSIITDSKDILVGSPVVNREFGELENLIGFFANTVVYRTSIKQIGTISELIQDIKNTALEVYNHQNVPYEKVVEAINPQRNLKFPPVFQVWFVMHPNTVSEISQNLQMKYLNFDTGYTQFDYSLVLRGEGEKYVGELNYNVDLYKKERIVEHVKIYKDIIRLVIDSSNLSSTDFFNQIRLKMKNNIISNHNHYKKSLLAKIKENKIRDAQNLK